MLSLKISENHPFGTPGRSFNVCLADKPFRHRRPYITGLESLDTVFAACSNPVE
jgi:hypothetical protein